MELPRLRALLRPNVGALKDRGTNDELPGICAQLGLTSPDPGGSKRERMLASFDAASDDSLADVARKFIERFSPEPSLRNQIQELLWADSPGPAIPKKFRRELARKLEPGDLYGDVSKFDRLITSLFEISNEPLSDLFAAERKGLRAEINQHVYVNSGDWTPEHLFERLGAFDSSDRRFCLFLEGLASADVRPDEAEQRRFVGLVNTHLQACGVELRETGSDGGYPVFTAVTLATSGANRKMYNLLVTGAGGAWDKDSYVFDFSRYLEHTDEGITKALKGFDDGVRQQLIALPTLFAYETRVDRDARVGWVWSIHRRHEEIRIAFQFDPDLAPISPKMLESLAWKLEIGQWEMNRTHWAVKAVDLLGVLSDTGAPSATDRPPYASRTATSIAGKDAAIGRGPPGRVSWKPSLPDPNVSRGARADLAASVDVVLVVATDVEREAMLRHVAPTSAGTTVRLVHAGSETYYVGQCGAFSVALLMCEAGASKPGAAGYAVVDAIDEWRPRAVIMPGIAFGRSQEKQRIGDVLVAEQVAPYELQRVGPETTIHRAPKPRASTTLINRFRNASDWHFLDAVGQACAIRVGEVMSGEKLVDNATLRASLFTDFPNAIGGEMEGVGLFAAAERRHVPWLLAKAICDFGAGKHDDDQPLAAASSAALVAHVLSDPAALDGIPRSIVGADAAPGRSPTLRGGESDVEAAGLALLIMEIEHVRDRAKEDGARFLTTGRIGTYDYKAIREALTLVPLALADANLRKQVNKLRVAIEAFGGTHTGSELQELLRRLGICADQLHAALSALLGRPEAPVALGPSQDMEIGLTYKITKMIPATQPEIHECKLTATFKSVGGRVGDWYVEIEFPTLPVAWAMDLHHFRVEDRSDDRMTLFRFPQKPLHEGDTAVQVIPYEIDKAAYTLNTESNGAFFAQHVTARAFVGGRQVAEARKPLDELQNF